MSAIEQALFHSVHIAVNLKTQELRPSWNSHSNGKSINQLGLGSATYNKNKTKLNYRSFKNQRFVLHKRSLQMWKIVKIAPILHFSLYHPLSYVPAVPLTKEVESSWPLQAWGSPDSNQLNLTNVWEISISVYHWGFVNISDSVLLWQWRTATGSSLGKYESSEVLSTQAPFILQLCILYLWLLFHDPLLLLSHLIPIPASGKKRRHEEGDKLVF